MIGFDFIENGVDYFLIKSGVPTEWAILLRLSILLTALVFLLIISFYVTKKFIIGYIYRVVEKSRIKWDDLLADHQVFNNLAHIVPAVFVRILAPSIFDDFGLVLPLVIKLTDIYLIVVGMTIVFAFLRVVEFAVSSLPEFKGKPLNSYFQLIRIILYIATGIVVLSEILNKSPFYFLSAFGAMTAILLLVFKDTILGLVASIQMSSNDMVKVGDWVEMPKFNADGDVIAINLNTVKVQNWDRTITTIPTYYFITDSFKNWRGMEQSGGRRIKRSIYIDIHSVKFVDSESRACLKEIHLIKEYLSIRQKEIEDYNTQNNINTSVLINGRRMTNIGVFRKYIEFYLKTHPQIRKDMTTMVRQLAPDNKGVPLEIYCFTNTTAWLEYETIQSDIFDHLFSSAKFFEIEIFQIPSGKDITSVVQRITKER